MAEIETMCLLTGKGYLPEWVTKTLNRAAEENGIDIKLIINSGDEREQSPETDLSKPIVKKPFHWLKERIEPNPNQYIKIENIDSLKESELIYCNLNKSSNGIGVTYPDHVVDRVRDCDIAFHHMVGILQGEILTAPEYGVLGFHHGDIRKYRGTPNAVWQYLNDEPTVGITLQRYNEKLDAGEIVDFNEVQIDDKYSLHGILSDLHQESIPMLAKGIQNIENGEVKDIPEDDLGRLYIDEEYTVLTRVKFFVKSRKKLLIDQLL